MSDCHNTVFVPYGAFELKAKYQRHFLYSNLLVIAAVGLTLVAFYLTGLLKGPTTVPAPPAPPRIHPIDWPEPPTIDWGRPDPGAGATSISGAFGIPEPVPDDMILDEDQVLASRDELAIINGPDVGDGTRLFPVVMEVPEEVYPAIDSFVPVEIPAERVYYETPVYPRLAEQAGIEGTVWIKALIDKEGKVRDVVIYRSSETASLDKAAVAAAWKCRFKPAIQSNLPVAVWVAWPYHFKLDH